MAAKGEIFVRIGADVSSLEKAVNTAAKHMEKFGRDMKRIGTDLTQAVTIPIAGLAYAAIRSSAAAQDAFDKFGEATKRSMGRLGTDIAKAIDLKGILNKVADVIDGMVTWFTKLDDSTKKWIVTIGFLAAAVGPVIGFFARFVEVFAKLMPIGAWLVKAAVAVAAFVAPFITLPVLITGAVAALVGFVVGWDNVAAAAKSAWDWSVKAVEAAAKAGDKRTEQQRAGEMKAAKRPGGPFAAYGPQLTADDFKQKTWSGQVVPQDTGKSVPGVFDTGMQSSALMFYGTVEKLNEDLTAANLKAADSQAKLGYQFELNHDKAQYEAGMVATLQDKYVALREAGLKPTSTELMNVRAELEKHSVAMANSATVFDTFKARLAEVPPMAIEFGNAIYGMYQQLAAGIGNALAQVIVYGASFAQVMKVLLKQIVASIIQTLVQLGIQALISAVIKKTAAATEASAVLASQASILYAEVFTQYAAIPLVGWAAAGGVAAAAVAEMLAGAAGAGMTAAATGAATVTAAGAAGAAEGGLFTTPGFTAIAEKGRPEIVLNQDNVEKFLAPALGGRNQTIIVQLDSQPIIERVVRGMPAYLRLHGAI
jgi:hypothetical protein